MVKSVDAPATAPREERVTAKSPAVPVAIEIRVPTLLEFCPKVTVMEVVKIRKPCTTGGLAKVVVESVTLILEEGTLQRFSALAKTKYVALAISPVIVAVELLDDEMMFEELLASKEPVVIARVVPEGLPLSPSVTLRLVAKTSKPVTVGVKVKV